MNRMKKRADSREGILRYWDSLSDDLSGSPYMWSLIRRFPNSLCLAWRGLSKTCGCRKGSDKNLLKGKGKALQKTILMPPGQMGQVGWKQRKGSREQALCLKALKNHNELL
jgi:hypothetical protein